MILSLKEMLTGFMSSILILNKEKKKRIMADFGFNYRGKNIILNIIECRNIFSQSRGLMFRKKSKPLLFLFKKPVKISIHSFFCRPFIAIWFNKNKIVDVKKIEN